MRRNGFYVMLVIASVCVLSASVRADSLVAIAEVGMPAPGTTGNIIGFGSLAGHSPAISGRNIVFGASTEQGGGIYGFFDGQLVLIADTATDMPGTVVHFGFGGFYGSGPSISGRNVAFAGPTIAKGDAIWASFDGVLTKIAGTDTPVPGSNGNFTSFATVHGATPSISGQNVAFVGTDADLFGVYARINGQIIVVADQNTLVPGETATFLNFGFLKGVSPSISGENVAFLASWDAGGGFLKFGIFAFINGELRSIAKTGQPKPEGGGMAGTNFGPFDFSVGAGPVISGTNVAFCDTEGIYAQINGALRKIVDRNTPFPGTTENFSHLGCADGASPSISGENITFIGFVPSHGVAIIAYIDGALQVVADMSTQVPGRNFNFTDTSFFSTTGAGPAISITNVVFQGQPPGGIYARLADSGIPVTSFWGVIVLTLLLLTVGSVLITRRRVATV